MRILVLGSVVRIPIGGMTWHYLHYVLGFDRLGHDVYYIEDSDDYPSCYDPSRHITDQNPSYGLAYAKKVFDRVGLTDRWSFFDAHSNAWQGPLAVTVKQVVAGADVLINISGNCPVRPWFDRVPVRVFVDTDPVFEQIRQLQEHDRKQRADGHNVLMSFGENVASGAARIPDDGRHWQPTRQPIVVDLWNADGGNHRGRLTTVMQWDSYRSYIWEGLEYGMKSKSFDEVMGLPSLVDDELEIALGSPNAPRDLLERNGWLLRDPLAVTFDPWTYQKYISQSKGEFTVAKHGYVVANSGWFSERSAAYLAAGLPVITQETGFSTWLEASGGVVPFTNRDEAVEAIARVNVDYQRHCALARQVACDYFDSGSVLPRFLDNALAEASG